VSIKAPRPAAGIAADEPPTVAQTQATDIIAGKGSSPHERSAEAPESRANPQNSGLHAVPTTGDRIGKYIVDKLLGSGGMGLVVAARHEETGADVAIKLLRPKAAGDRIHAERFAREARAITKIKSEHVVKVIDAGTLDESDAPFIVMEYLVGRDLSQTIREDGPLPVQQAADIMLQVCDAVASAHSVGVIHRDLKPSNFFVTHKPDGSPSIKVLDFGIAKAIGTDGVVDPNLTETQAVFGSPTYMSPEQIRSAKHVDHRSDIWSLGVAMYEVTTGRLPFAADNVAGLLASIVADPPYYPRGWVPEMPPVFEELLLACLHKDPKQRVQTAGDLGINLAPFATQGPETDRILASITRLSPPTFQPFPGETGPRMPSNPMVASSPRMSSTGPTGPQSAPHSLPQLPQLHSGVEDLRTSGNHVLGSTGSDLHAIKPKGGSKVVAFLGVLLAVAILALAVLGGAFFMKRPAPIVVTAPPKGTVSAAPAVTSAEPVTSAVAPPTSASSVAVVPSADPSAKPAATIKKNTAPITRPHPAPAPKPAPAPGGKPVDPTSDRF
jgi:serine/threonine-protein kinase